VAAYFSGGQNLTEKNRSGFAQGPPEPLKKIPEGVS